MKSLTSIFIITVFTCFTAFGQRTVKGRVADQQTNQPIVGATILAGANQGVNSDAQGNFEITTTGDSVSVLALGYSTKAYKIPASNYVLAIMNASNTSLTEVIVEGNASKRKQLETPNAIGLVNALDFARNSGLQLHQTLNLLPGVKVETRTNVSSARFVIRGYGNGNNFSPTGFKAYLNGIPLTDADGTTFLDDIDVFNLERVEIIKGPSSSLYGNGIGGVVDMQLAKATPGEVSLGEQLTVGSFGLVRSNTTFRSGTENSNIFGSYGRQSYDGFRVHGGYHKDYFNLGGDFYLSPQRTISAFASYTNSVDYLAGELDSLTLQTNPTAIDSAYILNNGHIGTDNTKISLSQDYRFNNQFSNKTSVFNTNTIIEQASAAGLTKSNKVKFGARTEFVYSPSDPFKITFGGEVIKNINYVKGYGLVNAIVTGTRSDFENNALQYNGFAQAEYRILAKTTITAGAGLNFLEYNIVDERPTATGYYNGSGYKRFDPIFAPRVAVNHLISSDVSVYGNISKGFSSPQTSQIVIPQLSRVNLDLRPEIGWNYEIGSKGSLLGRHFNYDLALYYMNVTDNLVTQNFPKSAPYDAYAITTNAGDVDYKGLELTLNYVNRFENGGFLTLLRPFISYTYNDFQYKNFKSDNNNDAKTKDYSGNVVAGAVKNLFNAGLDLEAHGFYWNNTFQYVDRMPLNFANSAYAAAYTLLNTKVGYRARTDQHWSFDLYFGVDNIGNTHYATLPFLNFFNPFGYNPMPGTNWYTGAAVKYLF